METMMTIPVVGSNPTVRWTGAAALIQPEPWVQDAACAETDPEIFFPEKGGSTREAKRVCRGCSVTAECLAFALRRNERYGIFGGKSERERRREIDGRPAPLSPAARKKRVGEMLADGWGIPKIAAACGVTTKTIERDREQLADEAAA